MRRPRKPDAAAGEADERTVRTAALALLAGRDFAREELAKRLARRGYPPANIESVVGGLVAERLLSETRFTAQFIRQHAGRGHGPLRIRMDLRERGVADADIDEALRTADEDWVAVRALVPKADTNSAMDQLYELGARGILVTDIHACRL